MKKETEYKMVSITLIVLPFAFSLLLGSVMRDYFDFAIWVSRSEVMLYCAYTGILGSASVFAQKCLSESLYTSKKR